MKTKLFALVLAGLFLRGLAPAARVAADDTPADQAKKALDALQGTWNGVSAEENGQALPKADAEGMQLVIKGDKYTFKLKGVEAEQGTLKVDPAKKPFTIDIKITKGDDMGKEQLGLYELDKDTFKLCISPPGKPRPKEIGAKQGSDANLYVFTRPKEVG